MKVTPRFRLIAVFAMQVFAAIVSRAQSNVVYIFNPNWSITIDDFGYSDEALDQRTEFIGREYLSGEWAAAVSYVKDSVTKEPTWLNPKFAFPDWDSNSDFGVETPVALSGSTNAYGFPIFHSVITNDSLRIGIRSEMIDSTNGIPQGLAPRSAPAGSNVISDRYIFRQTFGITNRSEVTLSSIKFFKFLHSWEAASAVYDDRAYTGTLNGHRYVMTQKGVSIGYTLSDVAPVMHTDFVAQHGNLLPDAWEVGHYGIESFDNHDLGKPSVGVHLSIETDSLSNLDGFFPSEKWVSGAVRQAIGTLAPNAFTNLEYLLTVRTETQPVHLKITKVGTNAVLSWPAITGDFFSLQEADSVTSTNWDFLFEFPEVQGTNNTVTVPIQPGNRFFKLW